jgi:tRNA dimethylallyltransferase
MPMTKPLIVIVGETASGKSELGLKIAKFYGGEIICADSWTVYKEFDIGTAKPTVSDQKLVPHHLLDIAEPNEGFSAAIFKRQADQAIDEITKRGKLPILVGATGLYIDAVLFDYGFLPAGDPVEREKLDSKSLDELKDLAKNKGLDLSLIDSQNSRRVVRFIQNSGKIPKKSKLRANTLIIGLKPDKAVIDKRISCRVEAMFEQGLVREVKNLSTKYGWSIEPMKGIGYREFKGYFEQQKSLEDVKTEIIRNTKQLAKKQRTWFKRSNDVVWFADIDSAEAGSTKLIDQFLSY